MIKRLFGDQEITKKEEVKPKPEDGEGKKPPVAESLPDTSPDVETPKAAELPAKSDIPQTAVKPFEVVEPIGKPKIDEGQTPPESSVSPGENESELELGVSGSPDSGTIEPKSDLEDGETSDRVETEPSTELIKIDENEDAQKINVLRKDFTPDTASETIRKTGLAWSAAIILFGAVAFMTLLGWVADLRLGTQPWGIVVGITFGAIIGFIQFFRTTSLILSPPKPEIKNNPIFSNQDEDKFD